MGYGPMALYWVKWSFLGSDERRPNISEQADPFTHKFPSKLLKKKFPSKRIHPKFTKKNYDEKITKKIRNLENFKKFNNRKHQHILIKKIGVGENSSAFYLDQVVSFLLFSSKCERFIKPDMFYCIKSSGREGY
jgi:hypothetical protein